MVTRLSVRTSDPGAASRAFRWPVLEAGNGSFDAGVYSVYCEDNERGRSIFLSHEVNEAALIDRWQQEQKLLFVCTVASPRSMYRALHKSFGPKQSIEWRQEDLGDFPTFTPMIVTRCEVRHVTDAAADGLNPIWDGKELTLPKGARVAVGPTFRFRSGISGLLDFRLDEKLRDGRFRIEPSSDDGFKLMVYLATDLHRYLQFERQAPAGMNVMVHVVSAALNRLREDYNSDDGEEGWQSFPNLVGLADMLQQKGLPHWTDDEFRSEEVATALHPHKLPLASFAADDER